MSLSKQAAFVLKVFFAASLGTNCFANQAVDQSAAAFNRIQSFRKACSGSDFKAIASGIGVLGAATSGGTYVISKRILENPEHPLARLLKAVKFDHGALIGPTHEYPSITSLHKKGFKAVDITLAAKVNSEAELNEAFQKGTQEIDRLSRKAKYLKRLGPVGMVLSLSIAGTAIAVNSRSAGEFITTVEKDILDGKGISEFAGITEMGDGTLSNAYASDPDLFLNEFLKLSPEQAKAYLSTSETLRNLTIGYSSYLNSLSTIFKDYKKCDDDSNSGAIGGIISTQMKQPGIR